MKVERIMKTIKVLALLWMLVLTPVYAQTDNGVIKIITTGGQQEIYPLSDIDSITIGREAMDVPLLEKVTLDDLSQLISGIYPKESPAMICELGSDNFIDNNVYILGANIKYTGLYPRLFTWSTISDNASYITNSDSPLTVWQTYLHSIAMCDYILKAADAIEATYPIQSTNLKCYRAEAYIVRSYLRSVLSGVFNVDFASLIEADLQEGLSLIDYLQDTDASRMTYRAANAYAARHYLLRHNWSKVEQYATAALGDNPAENLRNWNTLDQSTIGSRLQAYYSPTEPANYYVQRTYSMRSRLLASLRYQTPSKLFNGGGPAWNGQLPSFNNNLFIFGGQEYGVWHFRAYEFFEYIDEEAGVGYVNNMYTPFTAEETLLMRAEARYYQGNTNGCLADLNIWTQSKMVQNTLTLDNIQYRYTTEDPEHIFVNNIDMESTGWSEEDIQTVNQNKPLLDCILHFRRIETLYDGLRWMDLKRYGINIQHVSREPFSEEQTFFSNYSHPQPANLEAIGANQVFLHKNDESVAIQSVKEILFGSTESSDETARQSFIPSANGWVLQTFDLTGESSITYIPNEECQIIGEGFMTLGTPDTLYRILDFKAGEEFLLQNISEDSDYPTTLRLIACPMPWTEYQEACEQIKHDMQDIRVWSNANLSLMFQNTHIIINHDKKFTNGNCYYPFVYTPTGFRLDNEQALSCAPEFIFDKESITFTSTDGLMTFHADVDVLLQDSLTSSQRAITIGEENEELKTAIEAINTELTNYSASYSFGNLFFGHSTGSNSVYGIGISFYTNAEKTRSNTCGIASTLICEGGHLTISTPGLADGTIVIDKNMQTLINRVEEFRTAVLNMLNLMEGEYIYSIEYSQSKTIDKVTFTKLGNDTFKFSIQF